MSATISGYVHLYHILFFICNYLLRPCLWCWAHLFSLYFCLFAWSGDHLYGYFAWDQGWVMCCFSSIVKVTNCDKLFNQNHQYWPLGENRSLTLILKKNWESGKTKWNTKFPSGEHEIASCSSNLVRRNSCKHFLALFGHRHATTVIAGSQISSVHSGKK
jgi:hypothetical protein